MSKIPSRAVAEEIAVAAFGFLAGDGELLSRFCALSGLDLGDLRSAAAEPGFLPGVLSFIAGEEKNLTAFAAASGYAPETIGLAFGVLNPEIF